jgi:putative aldouronate transport system permease protein
LDTTLKEPTKIQSPKYKPGSFKSRFSRQKGILLLMIPGLLWYIIFKYLPFAGAAAAFTDFGTMAKVHFIGLDNFKRLFTSPDFWAAFRNTLLISGYNLLFSFPLPIILAIFMNELISVRFKKFVQFIVYIPHFFSWVVVGSIFVLILSPTTGLINNIIKEFGSNPIFFMADPRWFRSILVSSNIWRDVGYGTVIYIATISTIDPQLYEAATIDGAGYLAKIKYITLPSIKSTIATVLLLTVAHILLLFEQILVMYNASVYSVSEVLNTYSFTQGLLNGNIGYATAISLFTAVISALLVLGCNALSKKFLGESIL